jgi:hypothetical protein
VARQTAEHEPILLMVSSSQNSWADDPLQADPDSNLPVAAHVLLLIFVCCAPVQRYHDNGQNYGTYLHLQSDKMITEIISQTDWKVTADRSQVRCDGAGSQ